MSTLPAYRSLGASGLKVSPLWLGTMMFGDQTAEAEAAAIVDAALGLATQIGHTVLGDDDVAQVAA